MASISARRHTARIGHSTNWKKRVEIQSNAIATCLFVLLVLSPARSSAPVESTRANIMTECQYVSAFWPIARADSASIELHPIRSAKAATSHISGRYWVVFNTPCNYGLVLYRWFSHRS